MNRTDELGAAARYEDNPGLVLCHSVRRVSHDGLTPPHDIDATVAVDPDLVPHRTADGVLVPLP
jgi:hypothetical protein